MSIYGHCEVCRGETVDYLCTDCLHEEAQRYKTALEKIVKQTEAQKSCECGECVACVARAALMDTAAEKKSRYGWSSDPQTDRELRNKYGQSIHEPKDPR